MDHAAHRLLTFPSQRNVTFEEPCPEDAGVYRVGDLVYLVGECFSVVSFETSGIPGYWLEGISGDGEGPVFVPVDWAATLLSPT